MIDHPDCEFRKPISGVELEFQRFGILFLAAGSLQIDDQIPGHSQRNPRATRA